MESVYGTRLLLDWDWEEMAMKPPVGPRLSDIRKSESGKSVSRLRVHHALGTQMASEFTSGSQQYIEPCAFSSSPRFVHIADRLPWIASQIYPRYPLRRNQIS